MCNIQVFVFLKIIWTSSRKDIQESANLALSPKQKKKGNPVQMWDWRKKKGTGKPDIDIPYDNNS